ncbi:MAG: hypothetical protein AB1489_32330 [Acidobacteriota bacterium]
MKPSVCIVLLTIFTIITNQNSINATQAEPPETSFAKLWMVHIDEVEPAAAKEFERLSQAQTAMLKSILKSHEIARKPTFELSTNNYTYMTFRGRRGFTEFDQASNIPADVRKLLDEKVYVMDDEMHKALRTHYNQIWRLYEENSYLPENSRYQQSVPGFIRIHTEWIKPGKEQTYESVIGKYREALIKLKHPVGYLFFYVSYGDGSYKYLWQAENKQQFQNANSFEQTLVLAFGKQEAETVIQQWRECITKVADIDATPRPDLTNLDVTQGWLPN